MNEVRGWRRLLYLIIVAGCCSGLVTINAWLGVVLIQAGHLWWAVFGWGFIVFLIWEINND